MTTRSPARPRRCSSPATADIGLLLAILVLGQTYGTYSITKILVATGLETPRNATLIGLLLIVAVVGKSAQVPLQTWLPDAMPGPTPITALIHAATMVAAGVFLLARLLPVYATSEVAMTTLAVVATVTMLSAALFALVQSDLKRALAWSTVSQLAIMFAAVAVADGDSRHRPPGVARRLQGPVVPRLRRRHAHRRLQRTG